MGVYAMSAESMMWLWVIGSLVVIFAITVCNEEY